MSDQSNRFAADPWGEYARLGAECDRLRAAAEGLAAALDTVRAALLPFAGPCPRYPHETDDEYKLRLRAVLGARRAMTATRLEVTAAFRAAVGAGGGGEERDDGR